MAHKKIEYKEEARQKILRGVQALCSAVKVTLGPKGRNVVIEKKYGAPYITKDGVTVAKEIELEDKFENIGAQAVKEVANKTADKAGDGTTSATILATAIYTEGLKNVAAGANPMELKRGIEKAVKTLCDELRAVSRPIQSKAELAQVATISANGDAASGDLIATAMDRVGNHGSLTVEEGKGFETTLHILDGAKIDRGYLSRHFTTDNEAQEAVLEDVYILIYEKKISGIKEFLPVLQAVAERGKPLLIIAEDVEGEALATLVINKLRGGLKVCAIKSPGFGDRRKALLEDIAVLTNGTFFSEELGYSLNNVTIDKLGRARKVVVKKDETAIIEGEGTKEQIQARASAIRKELEESTSEYDREKLQERIAKLLGGVAVIRAGAPTEVEAKEVKDRLEDAFYATKAAREEGILPGGGSSLIHCLKKLRELALQNSGDVKVGIEIICKALTWPLKQIAENAGYEGAVIVEKVAAMSDPQGGWDAQSNELCNMVERGIVDPTKVVRLSVELAASIASLLLTTEAIIAEEEEEKPAAAPMAPGDY